MSYKTKLLIILTGLSLFSSPAWAAEWYVRSESGGPYGSGSGTSYNDAWRGFNSINWDSVLSGDTVYICGNFLQTLYITNQSNITFDGNCSPYELSNAIIDGENRSRAILVSESNNITLRNIIVKNGADEGIYFAGACNGAILENMDVQGNGNNGLVLTGDNVSLDNVIVRNRSKSGIIYNNSVNVTMNNITIENCGTSGENVDGILINGSEASLSDVHIVNQQGQSGLDMSDSATMLAKVVANNIFIDSPSMFCVHISADRSHDQGDFVLSDIQAQNCDTGLESDDDVQIVDFTTRNVTRSIWVRTRQVHRVHITDIHWQNAKTVRECLKG